MDNNLNNSHPSKGWLEANQRNDDTYLGGCASAPDAFSNRGIKTVDDRPVAFIYFPTNTETQLFTKVFHRVNQIIRFFI